MSELVRGAPSWWGSGTWTARAAGHPPRCGSIPRSRRGGWASTSAVSSGSWSTSWRTRSHYGGGVTEIAVRTGDGEHVEVTVDDAEPGIDPQERGRCSSASTVARRRARRGTGTGTGLGLALVAEHMRMMDGAVRVEASPAGGARFACPCRCWPTGTGREARHEAPGGGARRAGGGVRRGGLWHPDPGGAELHPALEGALPPLEPAPADDDDDAAHGLPLRAGQGLLLHAVSCNRSHASSSLRPRSRPSSPPCCRDRRPRRRRAGSSPPSRATWRCCRPRRRAAWSRST